MSVEQNLVAPTFSATDVYDRFIDLHEYRNKKVLIAFFRHAGCPFCNVRVHTLCKYYEEFKANGLEMIFFFESKKKIILRSSFHQGISPIPLISDPEKEFYNMYGLENSAFKSAISHLTTFVQTAYRASKAGVPIHPMADGESINTMPAEFLLDHDLIVKEVLYSQRLNDRMSIDKIKSFAKS